MRDDHIRKAPPEERADVRGMHAANRAAWDEAAERYEGWFTAMAPKRRIRSIPTLPG